MFGRVIERTVDFISRIRLRVRYCASTVLFASGIVYWVLGVCVLVASFFAMPVSLLALIPAIYLLCVGTVYVESRTTRNRSALLWWEVPALAMFVLGVVLLCNNTLTEDGRMMVSMEVVILGIMACPGIFLLTHGHSLFGPTALSHKRLKERYQNVIIKHIAESPNQVSSETQKKSDDDLAVVVKFGSILFACVFALMNTMILVDEVKKPVGNGAEEHSDKVVECSINGNLMVLMCRHIIEEKERPAYIFQEQTNSEEDSGWQCLCSRAHDVSDAVMVSMDKAIQLCPQLETIIRKNQH